MRTLDTYAGAYGLVLGNAGLKYSCHGYNKIKAFYVNGELFLFSEWSS
ncbi:hypothetical protein [Sphingobacterium faecium]|nr:hypothetical protein [Sphingobacterium faecium]